MERHIKNSMTSEYKIREIDHSFDSQWIEILSTTEDAVIFQHPFWLKALESEYGQASVVLGAFDSNDMLKGVFPLLPSNGFPFGIGGMAAGKRISSLPRTPLCGPVASTHELKKKLLDAASKLKLINDGYVLQVKSRDGELCVDSSLIKKINWRSTYTLSLPESPEQIRFGNKTKNHRIKSAVNKAINSGISIREAETEDDLKAWYKLYLETMRYVAVPARSYRLFKFLFENLRSKGLMNLLVAEINENGNKRLLTGSIFLKYNKTFFYSFNGRKMNEPPLHQNDLVLYTAIHRACAEGYSFFDFGEVTSDNEGLARFKSKWGCDEIQIYHYYYPLPGKFDSEKIDSGRGDGKLRKLIWNRLPLGLTKVLGDKIYKYL